MTVAETLQRDVEQLYERVTGTSYPRERFRKDRLPLPPQLDSVTYLRQKLDQLTQVLEMRVSQGRFPRDNRWIPVAEIVDATNQYEIRLELPGLSRDDVEVHASDHAIRITGERRWNTADEGKVLACERIYGPFERWITLPFRVNPKDLKLTFQDGVLCIEVAKTESRTSLKPVEISKTATGKGDHHGTSE